MFLVILVIHSFRLQESVSALRICGELEAADEVLRQQSSKHVEQEEVEEILNDIPDYGSLVLSRIEEFNISWLMKNVDLFDTLFTCETQLGTWLKTLLEYDSRYFLARYIDLRRKSFKWYGNNSSLYFTKIDSDMRDFAHDPIRSRALLQDVENMLYTIPGKGFTVPEVFIDRNTVFGNEVEVLPSEIKEPIDFGEVIEID